jgi:ubiquitin-activating enzyme E1
LEKPEFIESDLGKIGVPAQIHVGFLALHEFQKAVGSLPRIHNQEDADRIIELAKEINNKGNYVEQLNEGLLKQLAYGSRGQIAPFTAFYGGVLGQEVIKACTGKFSPIKQFLYIDAMEALPEEGSQTPEDFQPVSTCTLIYSLFFFLFIHKQLLQIDWFSL